MSDPVADQQPRQPLVDVWPSLSPLRAVVVYASGLLVAGGFAGMLWHFLSTPPNFTIGDDQGAIITEQGLSQAFAMDIWYVFIALAVALAVGGLTWGLFHKLGWPVVVITIVGALIAGLLSWQFGQLLGPRDFANRIVAANPGDRVPMDLQLHSTALVLVWPFVASLPVLLLAIWNRFRRVHVAK